MNLINERINKDKQTIQKLKAAGDDEQLLRLIDHSFTCDLQEPLEKLSESLSLLGFGDITLFQPDEESYFLLECTSVDCTEFHNVAKTSVMLALLSKDFNVIYNGWGCGVAAED